MLYGNVIIRSVNDDNDDYDYDYDYDDYDDDNRTCAFIAHRGNEHIAIAYE
jgi:hypothetical protein